jgi:hypothetical protein
MLKRLWEDEGGAIISAEIVLVLTILVLGMIVGLVAVRDAVINELADFAVAFSSLNMSYTIAGTSMTGDVFTGTGASEYTDLPANGGADQTALAWGSIQFQDVGLDEAPPPAAVDVTYAPTTFPLGY